MDDGAGDAVIVGSEVGTGELDEGRVDVGSFVGIGVNVGGSVGKSVLAGDAVDSGRMFAFDSVSSSFEAVGKGVSEVDARQLTSKLATKSPPTILANNSTNVRFRLDPLV